MAKSTVLAALLVPLALGGCKMKKGTANPEDYYPLIQVALGGGETAAMIGRNEAIKAGNFPLCVTAESLIAAFGSAGEALGGKITDNMVIPGFDIDLADCLVLRKAEDAAEPETDGEEAPEADGENAMMSTVMVAAIVAPAEEAPAEEKPAEEAATEEKPAEEAPAEEKPAEEAPAEEPATTEEAADAVAEATKGNEDVAVLVEAIAGMALVPATHYAIKLKAANCKKGTIALAAINYVNSMIKPIADEIANPDGKMSVAAQPINFSECEEG
jgi:hypothetical protein